MTFDPKKPSTGKGTFSKDEKLDHLLIFIEPSSELVDTQFGAAQPAARCAYCVDLDAEAGPKIEAEPLVFGTALVPALVDGGDELVVGTLGKANGNAGRTYWLLYDPSDEDLARAKEWLDKNAVRSPSSNRIMLDTSF
jgi:hypothetical protein